MKNEKIQTGLRIPEGRYDELTKLAGQIGVPLNSLILMLVDMGLSVRNREIILQRKEQG